MGVLQTAVPPVLEKSVPFPYLIASGVTAVYHVLLVDDNRGDIALLQEAVACIRAPMTLVPCETGAEALRQLAARTDIDLVLSDLNMPGMTGVQLFKRIREDSRFQHLPLVMMSSSDRAKLPKRIADDISVPYFTKASSWADFIHLAQELLTAVASKQSASSGRLLAERMTPAQGFAKFRPEGSLQPPHP